jgi:hypothetical protein
MLISPPRGHTLRKIDFSSTTLAIGGFAAVDFFGDGSFYLLDVPGVSLSFHFAFTVLYLLTIFDSIWPDTWPPSHA